MDPFYPDIESYARFFAIIVLGLCLGSFATALVYRIPKGISWVWGDKLGDRAARSRCPSCQNILGVFDLVPVFSWLFAAGKCRYCKTAVSTAYPIIEVTTTIFVLVLYCAWGWSLVALPIYLCVPFLIAAIKIDWDHMIFPDSINVALFVLGMTYVFLVWMDSKDIGVFLNLIFAGILLPFGFWVISSVLKHLRGRDALGLGDIKFLAPAGLFLGAAAIPSFMIVSGILGVMTALLKKSYQAGAPFPFGPALIISLYLHVFLTGLGFH